MISDNLLYEAPARAVRDGNVFRDILHIVKAAGAPESPTAHPLASISDASVSHQKRRKKGIDLDQSFRLTETGSTGVQASPTAPVTASPAPVPPSIIERQEPLNPLRSAYLLSNPSNSCSPASPQATRIHCTFVRYCIARDVR